MLPAQAPLLAAHGLGMFFSTNCERRQRIMRLAAQLAWLASQSNAVMLLANCCVPFACTLHACRIKPEATPCWHQQSSMQDLAPAQQPLGTCKQQQITPTQQQHTHHHPYP
jgi:hypothetical protein